MNCCAPNPEFTDITSTQSTTSSTADRLATRPGTPEGTPAAARGDRPSAIERVAERRPRGGWPQGAPEQPVRPPGGARPRRRPPRAAAGQSLPPVALDFPRRERRAEGVAGL